MSPTARPRHGANGGTASEMGKAKEAGRGKKESGRREKSTGTREKRSDDDDDDAADQRGETIATSFASAAAADAVVRRDHRTPHVAALRALRVSLYQRRLQPVSQDGHPTRHGRKDRRWHRRVCIEQPLDLHGGRGRTAFLLLARESSAHDGGIYDTRL